MPIHIAKISHSIQGKVTASRRKEGRSLVRLN